jgi:hypothetical protein
MSANFGDARIGYEHFIYTHGNASIDQINDFLMANNRTPISERTYTHYRSLMRYGFRSYFPINQFDVSRMLGQLPVAPDRRRYEREKIDIETTISTDGIIWILARIIDKSMIGFGMSTAKELPIKNGDPIWVRMKEYRDIPAILVWSKWDNNLIRFGVRAVEFVSGYGISEEKMPVDDLTGILTVRKTSEVGLSWKELYNLMGKIEKLLDASSELLKYVADITNRKVKVSPPVISSIKFSSPGELNVIIDWKVFALLIPLIKIVQHWRIEKDRLKEENRNMKLDNDMREFQIEFARKTLKSRKAGDSEITKQLLAALPSWVKTVLHIDDLPPALFKPQNLESRMAKEQLLPVAADLIGGDDPEIKVEAKESSSNEPEEK